MTMASRIFRHDRGRLERFLPASAFNEDNLDAAVTGVANALSSDGVHNQSELKRGLLAAFRDTRCCSSPVRVLADVRRWALEGLDDDSLPRALLPLRSPNLRGGRSPRERAARSVTAAQARAVLANAFLGNCLDPMAKGKDPWNAGGLDFRNMMRAPNWRCGNGVGISKVRCLLQYFDRCASLEGTSDDAREILFERIRFMPLRSENFDSAGEDNEKGERYVGEGMVIHSGTMESPTRPASAFINFANENFGYGRFIASCTQEEIMQVCCPEFNIGMLFIGKMMDDEVVNVQGVRRFSEYSGYLDSFSYEGPTETDPPTIQTILTMDASCSGHFRMPNQERDISKAYFAFREHARTFAPGSHPVISTGKWGCGAFGGLPAHKMAQQALAANLAGVDLDFSAFGSLDRCDEILAAMHASKPTAGEVMEMLQLCREEHNFVESAVNFLTDTQARTADNRNHENTGNDDAANLV